MNDRFCDFTSYISLAYKYILKIKSHEMKHFGLRASHVMCLFYIGKSDSGLSATELVSLIMEDKAAVSKALGELKMKGLIAPDSDDTKKYRLKYSLTDDGKEIHEKIEGIIENVVTRCGEGLSDSERAVFYKSLSTIVENLKNYSDTEGSGE